MISIVIPVYNEEANVNNLLDSLRKVIQDSDEEYEVVIVNDGSTDDTLGRLASKKTAEQLEYLRIINLRSNFGQTPALMAGFANARGEIIISMDGDLQNDPKDIPRLLEKMNEGFDVVCGWRKDRKDSILKKIPSKFSNFLNRKFNNISIHDSGCTFRAYTSAAAQSLNLTAEGHRYIPAILAYNGFKVTEVAISHHSRTEGVSKYGSGRLFRGSMDLLSLKLFHDYRNRPFLLFGKIGFPLLFAGLITSTYFIGKVALLDGEDLSGHTTFFIALLTIILAMQIILTGFIAELFVRENSNSVKTYSIKEEL